MLRLRLMTTAFLPTMLLSAPVVHAATQDAVVPVAPQKAATPRPHGASKPKTTTSAGGSNGETVDVIGTGSTRQIQGISAARIAQAAPGTNPLKILGQLPGVSFNSSDPLALDPWSQSFYVRGFSEDQLGFTLDNIPLGSQSYYSWNGLNVNSAITAENISRVNVSQGAGGVDIPSSSNLGGTVQFFSSDPSDQLGGKVSQSFGSYDAYRTFVRLDSGILNPTGTKFYVSYDRTTEDKWKGSGGDFLQQVNAKLVQPIGDNTTLKVFFDWAQEEEATYADSSLNIIHTLGTRVDYYTPDYRRAYLAAEGIFSGGYQLLNDPEDASYYDGPSTTTNYLGGINLDTMFTDRLHWQTTFYGHGKNFDSFWTNPYYTSPDGAPLSEQDVQYRIRRLGFTSDLSYNIAHNDIQTGVWFENAAYASDQVLYNEPLLGAGSPVDPYNITEAPYAQPWGLSYNTNTFQYHLEDVYRLRPNITLQAGFKSLLVDGCSKATANIEADTGVADNDRPSGCITAADAFLPQVSASWRFAPRQEVYLDISNNMRAYPESGFGQASPWSVSTKEAFAQTQSSIEPEKDWVYELGYRYTSPVVTGLLSLYHTDFFNRLQDISSGSLVDLQTTLENVGTVSMSGVDGTLTLRPYKGI